MPFPRCLSGAMPAALTAMCWKITKNFRENSIVSYSIHVILPVLWKELEFFTYPEV